MPAPRSMRIVPELRGAHMARHLTGVPAELLYFSAKYDLAGTDILPGIEHTTLLGAVRRFWSSDARILEVPEPCWLRFWPKQVTLAVGFKATGLLRGRRRLVCTYAMENNDFPTLVGGRRRAPRALVRAVGWLIGSMARLTLDRICYASEDARRAYQEIPFVSSIRSVVTPELPAPVTNAAIGDPTRVAFLGALEERKGLRALMTAWEEVERRLPSARLTIVGPGPLAAEIQAWADLEQRRVFLGALPHGETAAILRQASVVVAPSIPEGRWREQIGLPIKEALALGRTVVTTRQTALADWLSEHGHHVIDVGPGLEARLARAIVDALANPVPVETTWGSLPPRDGRMTGDAWLHRAELDST